MTEGVSSRTLSFSVYLILADFISRSFNTESYLYVYLFILLFSKLLAFSCEHLRTESGCIKTIYFSEITTVGDVFIQFCKCKKRIRLLWKYFTSFVTTANCFVYIDVLKFLSILIYFFYSFNYYNAVISN